MDIRTVVHSRSNTFFSITLRQDAHDLGQCIVSLTVSALSCSFTFLVFIMVIYSFVILLFNFSDPSSDKEVHKTFIESFRNCTIFLFSPFPFTLRS